MTVESNLSSRYFGGVDMQSGEPGYFTMYKLVVALVKAVEELQQTVKVMETDMWRMKAEIDSLDMKVESRL